MSHIQQATAGLDLKGKFLGRPVDFWVGINKQLDEMDLDKITALEHHVVRGVKLERRVRELEDKILDVQNAVSAALNKSYEPL